MAQNGHFQLLTDWEACSASFQIGFREGLRVDLRKFLFVGSFKNGQPYLKLSVAGFDCMYFDRQVLPQLNCRRKPSSVQYSFSRPRSPLRPANHSWTPEAPIVTLLPAPLRPSRSPGSSFVSGRIGDLRCSPRTPIKVTLPRAYWLVILWLSFSK